MSSVDSRTDEDLLRDCRNYLRRIADAELDDRLRSKVDPSDVVQSAMLNAATHFDSFRGQRREELFGWLASILRNEIRMTRRRFLGTKKRDARREADMAHPSWIAGDVSTPSEHVARSEELARLMRAMKLLPEDYQTVLKLRNWERLSFDKIGARMDRSAEATRKLWGRAVLRLQKHLDESACAGADSGTDAGQS